MESAELKNLGLTFTKFVDPNDQERCSSTKSSRAKKIILRKVHPVEEPATNSNPPTLRNLRGKQFQRRQEAARKLSSPTHKEDLAEVIDEGNLSGIS